MAQRASIRDVAALAGVSIKTVSRVVNGVSTVDQAIASRVAAAIAELHYLPNASARSLKTGAGNTIGVLVDSIDDVFFSSAVSAIEDGAIAAGLGVVIGSTGHDADRERDQLLRFVAQGVRGVILAPVAGTHPYLAPYRSSVPVVAVDRTSSEYDSVTVDDRGAAALAVRVLLDTGHRRIALVGWDPTSLTAARRRDGYRDALAAKGLSIDEALAPRIGAEASAAIGALDELLGLPDPPTALFVSNARHAATVVAALHVLRRTEVALVSFGDFLLADAVQPAVSCIDQDPREIGELAFRRLLELIDDLRLPQEHRLAPTWFVARETHLLLPSAALDPARGAR